MYPHHAFAHLRDSEYIQISCIWTCQGENVHEDSHMSTIYRKETIIQLYVCVCVCVCVYHMELFMNYCVAVYSDRLNFALSHSTEF